MTKKREISVLFVLYVLGIIFVSLIPGGVFPSGGMSYMDKVGHFLAYSGLGFLIGLTFRSRNGRLLVALSAICLGFLLEWGQSFIPGRDMSLADGLVNTCGVIMGMFIYHWWGHALEKRFDNFLI